MKINLENDLFFISLVKKGTISVSKNGKVINNNTGNYIGSINTRGYVSIGFKHNGKTKHILVHRLVYIVFKYKMRPLTFIVNHKDGIKNNNYYKNLERSNPSHNNKHAYIKGLACVSDKTITRLKKGVGELNPVACLTNKQANKIRKLYKTGAYSYRSLATKYNVHHSQIGRIVRNKIYRV